MSGGPVRLRLQDEVVDRVAGGEMVGGVLPLGGFDYPHTARDASERSSDVRGVLAPRLVLVGDDDNIGTAEGLRVGLAPLAAPLACAHRVTGRDHADGFEYTVIEPLLLAPGGRSSASLRGHSGTLAQARVFARGALS